MIRRAETPRDYFATFDCFDIIKGAGSVEKIVFLLDRKGNLLYTRFR